MDGAFFPKGEEEPRGSNLSESSRNGLDALLYLSGCTPRPSGLKH